ncbi:hypothetical protein KR018_011018, partial [Drosophila ironensis]
VVHLLEMKVCILLTILATSLRISFQAISNGPGLMYLPSNNVEALEYSSMDAVLANSIESSLVLFMDSFRSDDIDFVPTFNFLARELYTWKRILKIYFIDCAFISRGIVNQCERFPAPALYFYPPKYNKSNPLTRPRQIYSINNEDRKNTVAEMLHEKRIRQLEVLKDHFPLTTAHPSDLFIYPYRKGIVECIVLLNHPLGSAIVRDTIFGLLPFRQVIVVGADKEDLGFWRFGLEHPPNKLLILHYKSCSKPRHYFLTPDEVSAEGYVKAVAEFLQFLRYLPDPPLLSYTPTDINQVQRSIIFNELAKQKSVLYLGDLKVAVQTILTKIANETLIEGKKMIVLKNLITVLKLSFDISYITQFKLTEIYNDLIVKSSTIEKLTTQDISRFFPPSLILFDGIGFVRCRSSTPNSRGFPCSLWLLFHYLSVQSASNTGKVKPGSILWAFHGYVNHFFAPRLYYENLERYERDNPISSVETADDEILWLWRAHNHFNKLLAGGLNEDVRAPKIQFPSQSSCPEGRKKDFNEWNVSEVLKCLKRIYSSNNLSLFGLPHPFGKI